MATEKGELVNQEHVVDEQRLLLSGPLGEKAMEIGVFCSARDLSEALTEPARELGRLIGEQGHDLVWGGSDIGTMHVITEAARAAGARLIGVTTESLARSQHQSADEMTIASDLAERKMIIARRSDALIILPGGTGTLDEAADIIERKKFGEHYKPVIFLNSDGFYEGLKLQFDRMEAEEMLNRPMSDIASFANTPKTAMELVTKQRAEHMRPITEAHNLTEYTQITGGHSGAKLYRARDGQGRRFVVKVSNDKDSTKEVKSNIRAYDAIDKSGASTLIPEIITGEDPSGRKYIVMPDLGETFTFKARSEAGADYETFISCISEAFDKLLRTDSRQSHEASIEVVKNSLRQFETALKVGGIGDQEMLDLIEQIDPALLASDKTSFFLLDFTPDNIFIQDNKVQFIDPWEQASYMGSPIISLSQFQTLARDVYKLPGAAHADVLFDAAFDDMGEKLGLNEDTLRKHKLLGAALQFSLSAFVRIQSDAKLARSFYRRSFVALEEILEESK